MLFRSETSEWDKKQKLAWKQDYRTLLRLANAELGISDFEGVKSALRGWFWRDDFRSEDSLRAIWEDVVLGAGVSAGLLAWAGRWLWGGAPPRRGGWRWGVDFVRFAAVVLGDVVKGTWRMTRLSLGPDPGARQGVVEVPLGERSEEGARVSAWVATMAPGSVLLETDWERRVMRFHVADASQPEAFREALERFYREHQRAVFP